MVFSAEEFSALVLGSIFSALFLDFEVFDLSSVMEVFFTVLSVTFSLVSAATGVVFSTSADLVDLGRPMGRVVLGLVVSVEVFVLGIFLLNEC